MNRSSSEGCGAVGRAVAAAAVVSSSNPAKLLLLTIEQLRCSEKNVGEKRLKRIKSAFPKLEVFGFGS